MDIVQIRKTWLTVHEVLTDSGRRVPRPLRKVIAAAVISNPYAGAYYEQLDQLVEFGDELGNTLGALAMNALDDSIESYGKGGIVGINGEQEHAVACLTSVFGDALRAAVGGGKAWISSTTKLGGCGTSLDIPLAYKDEIWVRSHYDAVELRIPDAPFPDEIVVAVAVANQGRPHARLGGVSKSEADAKVKDQAKSGLGQ